MGLLAIMGESAANLLGPWPLKIVLDSVLRAKPTHGWLSALITRTVGTEKLAMLEFACAMVVFIALLDAVCSYAEKSITTKVGQWVTHDLRRTLYSQMQRLSMAYHDQRQTGDLISRVTSDIDSIQSFIVSGLLGVLINIITLLGMIVVMFYINWQFTLIALAIVPILFVIVYSYTRRIKRASREVREKEGEMISVVEEVLNSIRVVKAFSREDYEIRRLEEESLTTVEIALKARALKSRLMPIVDIVVAAGTCAVLWFGANMVVDGRLSAGSLVVFILYLGKMYKPMQELSKITDSYSKAAVGYERIQEILRSEKEIRDAPRAKTAPPFKGEIDFEHVDFCYEPDQMVLSDVNLHVEAGSMVALVGPTGAGKTTIINMIPRFYDPTKGTVKIDGIDVKTLKQKSMRQQISFVLQDTVLFRGPLWQNIAYGKPDARMDEIIASAKAANADEFIDKMPDGYDTVVGEHGMTLSGGQRQRIAIARAIIRKSPILILDEPTSGLDAESEQFVLEALDRLMEGKTSIVIAHRLSTIRKASAIFVVKDGSIVERGTHDELQAKGGVYASLYEIQVEQPETSDLVG